VLRTLHNADEIWDTYPILCLQDMTTRVGSKYGIIWKSMDPVNYTTIANTIGKTDSNTAGMLLSKNKDVFKQLGDGVWKIK